MYVRGAALLLLASSGLFANDLPNASEIVRRSLAHINGDLQAASQYSYTERHTITKDGKRTVNTYQVIMLDGSPYYERSAANGEPLTPLAVKEEQRKLQWEIARRKRESAAQRRSRIAAYHRQLDRNSALLREMPRAFDFRVKGETSLNGRRCFVLAGTPKPGYRPRNRETRVLTAMEGTLWVDEQRYQWVRLEGRVVRPVAYGFLIAHVQPGTHFVFEQEAVDGNVWLPSQFSKYVKARVLFWSRNSADEQRFWNYHRTPESTGAAARALNFTTH